MSKPARGSVSRRALRYVGPGFLIGVPARDLDPDEVASLAPRHSAASLVASGLYTEAASASAADEQSADSGKE